MTEIILVVEDEPALQETLTYNLKKEGYTVETVGDGHEALDLMTDALLIASAEGGIRFANPCAEQLFGTGVDRPLCLRSCSSFPGPHRHRSGCWSISSTMRSNSHPRAGM